MAGPSPPARAPRRPSPQIAQLKRTLYFLSRNTLAVIGLAIIVFFVLVAIGAFFYPAPSDELPLYCGTFGNTQNGTSLCPGGVVCTYDSTLSPPSPNCYPVQSLYPSQIGPTIDPSRISHGVTAALGPLPFGSMTLLPENPFFYNPFEGLIKGSQWSLGIAVIVIVSAAFIGLFLGAASGYFGGLVDEVIMRLTDIFLSIPSLLLTLVIIATVGYNIGTTSGRVLVLIGAFVITAWPIYTRIVRGQVLVTREQKYIEASKASGARSGRLIVRHIIPNSVYPVLVQLSLDIGAIPLSLGAIAFLGFHIFPTEYFPEWGTIAALSVVDLPTQIAACATGNACVFPWWQVLFPGITIFLFAIAVNFLSDGLRDALDPRLRR